MLGIATTARNASLCIAALASLSWSTAVLMVVAFRPLGSVYVVFFMPSVLAVVVHLLDERLLANPRPNGPAAGRCCCRTGSAAAQHLAAR